MAFQVKSFKELVSMTKEKLDEALIPLRIRAAKARADGELVRLEEKMLELETKINLQCAEKEPNFGRIADMIDEYELTERRKNQIADLVNQLFPSDK